MRGVCSAGLLLWAGLAVAQSPGVDEDERWIERYLGSAPAAVATERRADSGESLAFENM